MLFVLFCLLFCPILANRYEVFLVDLKTILLSSHDYMSIIDSSIPGACFKRSSKEQHTLVEEFSVEDPATAISV